MRWRIRGDGWFLSPALVQLAHQINDVWPDGGATDGTLGDASHSSRTSDHNPRYDGEVCALDVDEVIEDRGQQLVDQLVASRDRRIKYIIHEGRIWRNYDRPGIPAWTPAEYTGPNAHLSHVHISVWPDEVGTPWDINLEGDDMQVAELIAEIQAAGIRAGHDLGDFDPLDDRFPRGADGKIGPLTRQLLEAMALEAPAGSYARADHQHGVEWPPMTDIVTGTPI